MASILTKQRHVQKIIANIPNDRVSEVIFKMTEISKSGPSWIRTNEGARPADLQSAPVDRFGIDP